MYMMTGMLIPGFLIPGVLIPGKLIPGIVDSRKFDSWLTIPIRVNKPTDQLFTKQGISLIK